MTSNDAAGKGEHITVIKVPEAEGVFDTFESLRATFYDLRSVGFHHSDISLPGDEATLKQKLGKSFWQSPDLEDDPRAPRAHFVSEEAIGGSPAAVIGTILARRVGQHHKDYYANQVHHGGILMWVRTRDKEREELAQKIMKAHSGRDVHVHDWTE